MTETFDFAEAVARMNAGKIVGRRYRENEIFFRIVNSDLEWLSGLEPEDNFDLCDETWSELNAWTYYETDMTPTVSGKEAIAAFIDDPELIVRCVDWDNGWRMAFAHQKGLCAIGNGGDTAPLYQSELQQGRFTVTGPVGRENEDG